MWGVKIGRCSNRGFRNISSEARAGAASSMPWRLSLQTLSGNIGRDVSGSSGARAGAHDGDFFTRGLGIWAGFDPQRNPEPKPKPEVMVRTLMPAFADIRYLLLGHTTLATIT
ncbi:MAG: hypothetical protein MUO24_08750 [Desulfobacterales bacterium]|nr:hypothetical protein [Desulfobacterales bacterium]